MSTLPVTAWLEFIRRLHAHIRESVVDACEAAAPETMAAVAGEAAGDTIYAIDRIGEATLVSFFQDAVVTMGPVVLIAEGVAGGRLVLPAGATAADAGWRIIVDPIDGTRGLMFQKRSGWILTGVAPNRGAQTDLADVALAVQTEIPLIKQHLSDQLWAVRGRGVTAVRYNRLTGATAPLAVRPSTADSIAHGFAMIARFFPGARQELAAIDEEIVRAALGPVTPGKAHCFEDQYICTGGQLYELMAGRDRFVADIRPLMETVLARDCLAPGICCHPYDLCTALIAREAGVIVTDPAGRPLAAPLDVTTDVGWVGYANPAIRRQMEPLLQAALRRRGLICG